MHLGLLSPRRFREELIDGEIAAVVIGADARLGLALSELVVFGTGGEDDAIVKL